MSMQIHGPSDSLTAEKIRAYVNSPGFVVLNFGPIRFYIDQPEQCDWLIKTAVEAKRLIIDNPAEPEDEPAPAEADIAEAKAKAYNWCPAFTGPDDELDRAVYCDRQTGHPGNHRGAIGDGGEIAWPAEAAPNPPHDVTQTTEESCRAEGGNYICSSQDGHDGPCHVAWDGEGNALWRWPIAEPAAARAHREAMATMANGGHPTARLAAMSARVSAAQDADPAAGRGPGCESYSTTGNGCVVTESHWLHQDSNGRKWLSPEGDPGGPEAHDDAHAEPAAARRCACGTEVPASEHAEGHRTCGSEDCTATTAQVAAARGDRDEDGAWLPLAEGACRDGEHKGIACGVVPSGHLRRHEREGRPGFGGGICHWPNLADPATGTLAQAEDAPAVSA